MRSILIAPVIGVGLSVGAEAVLAPVVGQGDAQNAEGGNSAPSRNAALDYSIGCDGLDSGALPALDGCLNRGGTAGYALHQSRFSVRRLSLSHWSGRSCPHD